MTSPLFAQHRSAARRAEPLAFWLSTWFGCGLVPVAPGTAGTIGAVPLYLAVRHHGLGWLALAAALVLALGLWSSSRVARAAGEPDPQFVCIDEAAGVLVCWLGAPPTTAGLLVGLVLFRLLDQFKPFPAGWAEKRLPGGSGIMFDDIFAGLWGAALMLLARRIGWL